MSPLSVPLMRFSTDDVPERERIAYWCDGYARVALKLTCDPIAGRPFRQVGNICVLENLGIAFGESNGFLSWRDKAQIADSNDDLLFNVNLTASSLLSQLGRELRLDPGEAALLTCGETMSHNLPEPIRALTLRIPRRTLTDLIPDLESSLVRRVPASNQALRLLIDYIGLLRDDRGLAPQELQRSFVTHVHDLVALSLGANRDATHLARLRGLRAARLSALKNDIIKNIDDQSLSVAEIAKRHRVTPRYVQILFESEGRTFTEFVIERRLERAHRMLTDPRHRERTISAIAFDVGFANLSYFNRVFRRRYFATPSELRETDRGKHNK
jgi:AraC-like DNA-binding protein